MYVFTFIIHTFFSFCFPVSSSPQALMKAKLVITLTQAFATIIRHPSSVIVFADPNEHVDHCSAFRQKNPKSADFKCPDKYQPVLLHSGTSPTSCRRVCERVLFFFKHCLKPRLNSLNYFLV